MRPRCTATDDCEQEMDASLTENMSLARFLRRSTWVINRWFKASTLESSGFEPGSPVFELALIELAGASLVYHPSSSRSMTAKVCVKSILRERMKADRNRKAVDVPILPRRLRGSSKSTSVSRETHVCVSTHAAASVFGAR